MARFSKGEWAVGEAEVEWRWVVEEEEEGGSEVDGRE